MVNELDWLSENWNRRPWLVVGISLVALLAGAAVLYFIVFLLGELIKAIGASIGIAAALMAGTATFAAWIAPAATIGIVMPGTVVTVRFIGTIVTEIEEEPFQWLVPILGGLGGIVLNISTEFSGLAGVVKIIFGVIVALLLSIGGMLFKKAGIPYKILGVILCLLPLITVLALEFGNHVGQSLPDILGQVAPSTWLSIGMLFIIVAAMTLLAYITREKNAA